MNKGQIIEYKTPDGNAQLDVKLDQDSVWLSQNQIAELFETKRAAITKHLKKYF